VIGKTAAELGLWEDAKLRRTLEQKLKDNTPVRDEALTMRVKEGGMAECLVAAERVEIADQQCVVWALQDVTERRRTEDELIQAIESVMADTSWFSRTVVDRLATLRQSSRGKPSMAQLQDLSERETEILSLICQGLSDAEMGDVLHLSKHTIRNHVASLYAKIGVNRRAAAVIWARERGFLGEHSKRR
jgi:DNA-binding NarL/FixJ family response regulator